jgi:Zn-dependent M28 family amino/carboxypeptidase
MDGLNWYGKTNDIIVIGKGQSELEKLLQEEAAKEGRVISYETHPEAGFFYRSDHFNFAKVGIPALFTGSGIDVIGKGKEYGKQMDDQYTANHYHRPSDEYDAATWKTDGAIADLILMYRLGRRLAYGNEWPKWNEGSEFKAVREKSQQ